MYCDYRLYYPINTINNDLIRSWNNVFSKQVTVLLWLYDFKGQYNYITLTLIIMLLVNKLKDPNYNFV